MGSKAPTYPPAYREKTVNIQKHFELLGLTVRDRVTGTKGVVTSLSFDLFGCIQATIDTGVDKDMKKRDTFWWDISRLEVIDQKPVMNRPEYKFTPEEITSGRKGPADKPRFENQRA